jgi:hypothetical protein
MGNTPNHLLQEGEKDKIPLLQEGEKDPPPSCKKEKKIKSPSCKRGLGGVLTL